MTRRHTLPLFLLLLIIVCSCENEIPFDWEANPPRLVMNALINADSTNNVLYLNRTGQNVITDVTEARVEVRVNDALVETPEALPIDTEGNFISFQKRFLLTTKFNPGDKVRIDAIAGDGAQHAWAEVTVPQPPLPIVRVDTATVSVNEYDNYYTDRLRYRITITDRPGGVHYYRLVLDRISYLYAHIYSQPARDTVVVSRNFQMLSREDVVLTDGHPSFSANDNDMLEQAENIYGVFDNSRFAGQSYTMTVYPNSGDTWPYLFPSHDVIRRVRDCYIRLLSISETDYRYYKALNLIDSDVYDETIMEPIVFASNVQGGLGIVSISTETSIKITEVDELTTN